ncbi:hypothetical protein D3C76_1731640 [compost metagenome]
MGLANPQYNRAGLEHHCLGLVEAWRLHRLQSELDFVIAGKQILNEFRGNLALLLAICHF